MLFLYSWTAAAPAIDDNRDDDQARLHACLTQADRSLRGSM
jgi:hypothetical protein